jgi:ribonuclease D
LALELDKSESRTDWTKRPLTDSQLSYAAADVEYLFQVTPELLSQAEEKGWLAAAKLETEQQIAKKFKKVETDKLYLDMKLAWRLSPAQLNRLKSLCTWRYEQAVKRDLPIGFIAKDHTLLLLAERNPKSVGAMAGYSGIEILDVRHQGKAMLNILKKAGEIAPEMYPHKVARLDDFPGYKQIFKKVKEFIAEQAKLKDIPMEVCASKKQINLFLSYFWQLNGVEQTPEQVDFISTWRYELCGKNLIDYAQQGFSL